MKTYKVCMIGDFAVGKTSLVARYVHHTFSDRYLTTLGVKIDTKVLNLPSGDTIKLVLWDVAGKSEFASVDTRYLRDAAGVLMVTDGTRIETLANAKRLKAEIDEQLGHVPFCLLLNKVDLKERWLLNDNHLEDLGVLRGPVIRTSALTGEGVETAFAKLGSQLVHAV